MSSIQQLIERSRADRVQVADLGDAPSLRPTISAGGRYSVQTQQVGTNKWENLADSLSQINPLLKNYTAAMETDAELYEKELGRLSPEDVLKELKKSENALDNQVRTGNIPFLGSPLNWKRKQRALGAAAYEAFRLSLVSKEGRFYGGAQEGDDDLSAAQIIEDERQKFIEDNPVLQSTIANEGFQEVINPLVQNLTDRFDSRKNTEAKTVISTAIADAAIRTFEDTSHLDSENFETVMDNFVETQWLNLNAFSPTEQKSVIATIAKNLATVDENRALAFLDLAKTKLRVGNGLYGSNESHINAVEELIEKIADEENNKSQKERKESVYKTRGEFTKALNDLQYNRVYETAGGTEIRTKAELVEYFKTDVALEVGGDDAGLVGELQGAIDAVARSEYPIEEELRNSVKAESILYNNLQSKTASAVLTILSDYEITDDKLINNYSAQAVTEAETTVARIIKQGVEEGKNTDSIVKDVDAYIENDLPEDTKKMVNDLVEQKRANDKLEDERESSLRAFTTDLPEKADDSRIDRMFRFFPANEQTKNKARTEQVQHNYKVLLNTSAEEKERNKALRLLLQNPKGAIADLKEILKAPTTRVDAYYVNGRKINVTQQDGRYNTQDRKEAKDALLLLATLDEQFTDLDILKTQTTNEGIRFDISKLNAKIHTILTEDEIRDGLNSESVKEKAELLKIKNIKDFIKDQRDLRNTFKTLKR